MAQKSRPDPASGNAVNADEYEAIGLQLGIDGVYGNPAGTAVVYADSTGRQVKVRAGKWALVRGYEWFSDSVSDETINNSGAGLPANTSGNPRIDRLVLRLDRTARTVRTQYLQGTPAASPTAPALTQSTSISSGFYDFPLARWNVASGYTTVAASDLTIEHWYPQPSGVVLCTSTSRPFGVNLYAGQEIYETDNKVFRAYDGAGNWPMSRPYRQQIILPDDTSQSVTFSSIPTFLKYIRITYNARSAYTSAASCQVAMRVNGNSSSNYYWQNQGGQNATAFVNNVTNASYGVVGHIPCVVSGDAKIFNTGTIDIAGWNLTAAQCDRLTYNSRSDCYPTQVDSVVVQCGGIATINPPWTSLTLLPIFGPLGAGSQFTLEGWD